MGQPKRKPRLDGAAVAGVVGRQGRRRTAGSDTGAGTLTEEEEKKGEGRQHPESNRGAGRVPGRRSSTWQETPRRVGAA